MSERDERLYLQDMLSAARRIRSYLEDRRREDLDADPMLQDAVCRQFEVLGEAAGRVSESVRETLPGLPWSSIVGMRHQLIHAYHRVDLDIVWRTAMQALPDLIEQLEAAVRDG